MMNQNMNHEVATTDVLLKSVRAKRKPAEKGNAIEELGGLSKVELVLMRCREIWLAGSDVEISELNT